MAKCGKVSSSTGGKNSYLSDFYYRALLGFVLWALNTGNHMADGCQLMRITKFLLFATRTLLWLCIANWKQNGRWCSAGEYNYQSNVSYTNFNWFCIISITNRKPIQNTLLLARRTHTCLTFQQSFTFLFLMLQNLNPNDGLQLQRITST